MTDTVEASPLLGQDAFQTDESQRLFEAIDDLRRCGAKQEIDLPEVRAPFPRSSNALR